jgi:regulation of enolase protein 1 (concanavalin A-like superfamily)
MIQLFPIPNPLTWHFEPQNWNITNNVLTATAGAKTDLFVDPLSSNKSLNASMLVFENNQDFMLSSRVTVDFNGTFDAGVLVVYQHETSWAKFCFEYSPNLDPMVVSVVTKGTSDDCNSVFIDGRSVYLRISRINTGFAFHFSNDAKLWHLIRAFALEPGSAKVGFLVQAPIGDSCTATFSEIAFEHKTLADIRSGS